MCSPSPHAARELGGHRRQRRALGQPPGAVQVRAEVAVAQPEPRRPAVAARRHSIACHVSPASPQPVSGLTAPASVYSTVSRSGLTWRPYRTSVVADVDDGRDLARVDDRDEPGQEAGCPNAAGEHGDHAAVTRPVSEGRSWPDSSARSASTIIAHELRERHLWLPTQHLGRVAGVANEQVDLGRAHELLVLHDVAAPSRGRRG